MRWHPMSPFGKLTSALPVLCAVIAASAAGAQQSRTNPSGAPSYPASFTEPMPLHTTALGSFTRRISSANREAQAYLDQGFQQMYAFAKNDAARSFREAQKRDPSCAICFWGEAWAWGSYLNGPMTEEEAPRAYAAIQKALAIKGRAPEKER